MPSLQHNVFITSYDLVWLKLWCSQYAFIYRKHYPISYRIRMLNDFMRGKSPCVISLSDWLRQSPIVTER